MHVQTNTDHNIQSDQALSAWIIDVVETALVQGSGNVMRVEVHLGDENGRKSGQDDKRCMMEARIKGRHPIAVIEHAASLDCAIKGAAGKLARMIESDAGRAAEF